MNRARIAGSGAPAAHDGKLLLWNTRRVLSNAFAALLLVCIVATRPAFAQQATAAFYATDGKGGVATLRTHPGWSTGWSLIVPGNFGGTDHTDLLFYDRRSGVGDFYTTDGDGNITHLKRHAGWRKTWSAIVPVHLHSNSHTDLLFYDRTTGEIAVYMTDDFTNMTLLRLQPWRRTWSIVVPIDGRVAGKVFTDLLFYDAAAGVGEFYAFDQRGALTLTRAYGGWRKTWSVIVPLVGPGSMGLPGTDLLFYDSTRGETAFFEYGMRPLRVSAGVGHNWSDVVPGGFGSSNHTDFFLYDAATKVGEFHAYEGNGNTHPLGHRQSFGGGWTTMVPGNFDATPTTDLLGYRCTPNCATRKCGDDGCGGTCGACLAASACVNGACQPGCREGAASCEGDTMRRCENATWTRVGSCSSVGLAFSYFGPLPGWNCTQVTEPADPHGWHDNYFCSKESLGFRWSSAGRRSGMRCTKINEAAEHNSCDWKDNYLCVPKASSIQLVWSQDGAILERSCLSWNEPSDPNAWNDNHLCWSGCIPECGAGQACSQSQCKCAKSCKDCCPEWRKGDCCLRCKPPNSQCQ